MDLRLLVLAAAAGWKDFFKLSFGLNRSNSGNRLEVSTTVGPG
jgi:hypothetical protein